MINQGQTLFYKYNIHRYFTWTLFRDSSIVNMHLQFTTSDGQVIMFTIFTAFTRFKIMRPSEPKDLNLIRDTRKVHEDEDGDLSPPRKNVAQDDCDVITIGTGTLVLFYFFCV